MKIIKILGLICILTIGVLAQTGGNIEGILKKTDGTPFDGITIKIEKNGKNFREGSTDKNGEYFLEDIPDGNYVFIYTNETDREVRETIRIINGEVLRGRAINELVTVSANTTQTLDEVSKTVNIIGAQELRDRADFALVETLRTIPGFRVQQLGGFGRTANIKTRGLRNQDTAILIDGIRFRDASAITGDASAFLSDFTLTSVSKIEVLRGSGSSLYGTNAIGGTIDFQTPKPQSGFHGNLSGAVGGLGLGRFRGNTSYGTDKFGFNLGVSRTVYTKGIDGEDDAHNTNFQSRIEYNPFQNTNISARFFVSDAYVRLNSNPDTFGTLPAANSTIIDAEQGVNFVFDQNDPDSFQKSKFFNRQIVLTQVFNDKLVFQGYYSGLKTSRKNTNGNSGVGFQPFGETSFFDGLINTANGHFNWTPNRFNEITFGYEYEHEKFGNDGLTFNGNGDFSTRAKQSSNTFYVQDLLKFFNNKLQIAGGFRTQFFNLENPVFSSNNAPYENLALENPPNAYTFDGAASYFFAKSGTKIRAHVGNGYRVPSLFERFGTFYSTFSTPPNFVALGDPNLKPERTIAFDGGIEQNLFKNRAKLTAVYFYTKLLDIIGFDNFAPSIGTTIRPFGGYFNTNGGIARGAEFSGQVRATDSTDIFASYTFTNSDQRTAQVFGSGIIETLGIPKHQFTLVATQRFKRAWVNFDFLATNSYLAPIFSNTVFNTFIYRFDGNRRADLTAGYTFPFNKEKLNLRIFGTIENLFNYDYYENGFRTVGRNGRIGLSFGF